LLPVQRVGKNAKRFAGSSRTAGAISQSSAGVSAYSSSKTSAGSSPLFSANCQYHSDQLAQPSLKSSEALTAASCAGDALLSMAL
jgi:hypothetical protein